MPRTRSTAVAVRCGATPGKAWRTSASWRWPTGAYVRTTPARSGWWLAGPGSCPAADEPTFASTITSWRASKPPRTSGSRARMVAVAMQPHPANRVAPGSSGRGRVRSSSGFA